MFSMLFFILFSKSFFGFGQTAEISIELADSDKRKQVEIKNEDDRREKHFLYYDGETVSGTVSFDFYLTILLFRVVILSGNLGLF